MIRWAGVVIFVLNWLLLLSRRAQFLPVGRPGGTLLCVVLMLAAQVLTPTEAWHAIEHGTLALLFGTMYVVAYISREHLFEHFAMVLAGGGEGGKVGDQGTLREARWLMVKVCLLGGVLSALLTNDTVCVCLTPVLCRVCLNKGFPIVPFLVALATSANVGSAATPIGNPQNMIITTLGELNFGDFVLHCGPVALLCLLLNTVFLWLMYRSQIQRHLDQAGSTVPPLTEQPVDKQGDVLAAALDPGQPLVEKETVDKPVDLPVQIHIQGEDGGAVVIPTGSDTDGKMMSLPGFTFKAWFLGDSAFDVPIEAFDDNPGPLPSSRLTLMPTSPNLLASVITLDLASHESVRDLLHTQASAGTRAKLPEDWQDRRGLKYTFSCLHVGIKRRRQIRRGLLTLVLFAMLMGFVLGLNLGVVALAAAVALIVVDSMFTQRRSRALYAKVDWVLLMFFTALFITVHGLQTTGLPTALWSPLVPKMALYTAQGSQLLISVSGVAAFTGIIIVLSNLVSNVPTVLLVAPQIAALVLGADARMGWYMLAFVSTLAGNLTLIGSMASIIVAETAATEQPRILLESGGQAAKDEGCEMTFVAFTKFGFWSTLLELIAGVPVLALLIYAF